MQDDFLSRNDYKTKMSTNFEECWGCCMSCTVKFQTRVNYFMWSVCVCLYMCFALSVYVCVCMWYVHRCMYKCGLKGRPRKIMCDCLPLSLSPFVFKLAYLAMEPQRPTCVCLQMLGLQAHKAVSSLFTWVPGVWTPILIPSPQDLVLFVKINKSIISLICKFAFFLNKWCPHSHTPIWMCTHPFHIYQTHAQMIKWLKWDPCAACYNGFIFPIHIFKSKGLFD